MTMKSFLFFCIPYPRCELPLKNAKIQLYKSHQICESATSLNFSHLSKQAHGISLSTSTD